MALPLTPAGVTLYWLCQSSAAPCDEGGGEIAKHIEIYRAMCLGIRMDKRNPLSIKMGGSGRYQTYAFGINRVF